VERRSSRSDGESGVTRSAGRLAPACAIALFAGTAVWLFVRESFFVADDWINLAQAREHPFSLDYLRLAYYGHFAPGHRVLDWMLGVHIGADWGAALAIFFAFYAVAVIALHALVRELGAPSWLALLATVWFALSPVWVRVLQWWASGAHVVPAMALTLVALALSFRWFETHSTPLLAGAAAALAGALAFYEKPTFTLGYLVLVRYFVRPPARGRFLATCRSDLPLTVALGGVTALYLVVIETGPYASAGPRVSIGSWLDYLGLSWARGVVPFVVGQASPAYATPIPLWLVIASHAVLIAIVVTSVALRRGAWRAWAFLVIVWLASAGAIGYGRLGGFGSGIALDPRYNAELAFLLPLATVLAFTSPPRVAGQRRMPARARSLVAAAAVVVLALFVGSSVTAFDRLADSWQGPRSREWADTLRASASGLRSEGFEPSVRDDAAPFDVVAGVGEPFDRLSRIVPLLDGALAVGTGGVSPAIVESDGTVRRGRVAASWIGELPALARDGAIAVDAPSTWQSQALCSLDEPVGITVYVDGFGVEGEAWLGLDVVSTAAARTIDADVHSGSRSNPGNELHLPVPSGAERTGGFIAPGQYRSILLAVPARTCVRAVRLLAVT
jgi:hypothetical protein